MASDLGKQKRINASGILLSKRRDVTRYLQRQPLIFLFTDHETR